MQYNLENSDYTVVLSSSNFEVSPTAQALLEVKIGECAIMEAEQAICYIKSGSAEIAAAVAVGIEEFAGNVTQYINLARDWANKTDGLVEGNEYSAKYYANLAASTAGNMADKNLANLSATGEAKFTAKQDVLISGDNIKTINGSTLLGSGDLIISVDADNISIAYNSSDELQAVGVINQNATSTALKSWSGSKAQYDAITTKDSNTLYHITDDTTDIYNTVANVINRIYPVGSIYLTVSNDNPATLLGLGTWQKVASGRVLQGSDNDHAAGTTIAAGLPNIEGELYPIVSNGTSTAEWSTKSGAFNDSVTPSTSGAGSSGSSYAYRKAVFNASKSSSVYGNSTTVQPPAFVVNIWERIA